MTTLQNIKRAVAGGYIKADMTGTGTWEHGRITRFDSDKIWFHSVEANEEVWVARSGAYKATQGEYELALHRTNTKQVEESGEPEDVIDTLPEEPEKASEMSDEDIEELNEEEASRSVVPKEYKERYEKVKLERDGKKRQTQDCGDELATALRGKTLWEVYEFAAQILDVPLSQLHAKYEHLNNGQQRMVLGNLIRHA